MSGSVARVARCGPGSPSGYRRNAKNTDDNRAHALLFTVSQQIGPDPAGNRFSYDIAG